MSKGLSKDPRRRPLRNVINEQGKQSIIFTLKKYGGHYGLTVISIPSMRFLWKIEITYNNDRIGNILM